MFLIQCYCNRQIHIIRHIACARKKRFIAVLELSNRVARIAIDKC